MLILSKKISTIVCESLNIIGEEREVIEYGMIALVQTIISVMSSNELDFSKELRQTLIYGGYLHDVGKINTNKEVLLKTRKIE